jgi:hypothetical protein
MGTTYSNCQVRTDSQEAVVAALTGLLKESAYVAPAVNGWVGVYPEGGMTNPKGLAKQLSEKQSTIVFCWNVYDSDVFSYTLYESGKARDEFNSAPGYFEGQKADGDDSEDEPIDPVQVQGKPEILLPLCVAGTTLAAIQAVLHPRSASEEAKKLIGFSPVPDDQYLFADFQANNLAALLGMDKALAALGFQYLEAGETEEYALEDFKLAGVLTAKARPQRPTDKAFLAPKPDFTSNRRDNNGVPKLVAAARTCSVEFVQGWLSGGCDVNIVVEVSSYHLEQKQYMLIAMGTTDLGRTVNYLCDSLCENGVTSLIAVAGASIAGVSIHPPEAQLEVIRILLDAGADVNARSETGRTALGEALKMTDPIQHQKYSERRLSEEFLTEAAKRSAQVVEMLRAAGATE